MAGLAAVLPKPVPKIEGAVVAGVALKPPKGVARMK